MNAIKAIWNIELLNIHAIQTLNKSQEVSK